MRKFVIIFIVIFAYFFLEFFKTIYRIETTEKKDSFSSVREMIRIPDVKKQNKEESTTPIFKEEKQIEENLPAIKTDTPDPVAPLIDHNMNEKIQDQIDDPNLQAICFTQFFNCEYKDLMFNYPSDENPLKEETDQMVVECLSRVSKCNQGYQILSQDEVKDIILYYSELRKQEKLLRDQKRWFGQPNQ